MKTGKVLVVSDPHLTCEFDQEKCEILESLIKGCDLLIINGDFYEEYRFAFDEFLRSEWSQLFSLMLERQTICVLGNHDAHLWAQDYKKFCTRVEKKLVLESGGETFVFMHGHNFKENLAFQCWMPTPIRCALSDVAKAICKRLGPKHLAIYKLKNFFFKRWKRKKLGDDVWLITGHSHYAEVDRKTRYANSGLFLSKDISSYLLIEDGEVSVHYPRLK